jgi:plasmid stability protein
VPIKNAPDEMMKRLKERAERRRRSMRGERLPIQEDEVSTSPPLTPDEVLSKVRQLGLSTPREAAAMIRKHRDDR